MYKHSWFALYPLILATPTTFLFYFAAKTINFFPDDENFASTLPAAQDE